MSSSPVSVGIDFVFSGCTSTAFVRSSGQILLARYLMYSSSNLEETYREYSLVPTDDLIRFCRSRSRQAVEVSKATTLMLGRRCPSSAVLCHGYRKVTAIEQYVSAAIAMTWLSCGDTVGVYSLSTF